MAILKIFFCILSFVFMCQYLYLPLHVDRFHLVVQTVKNLPEMQET